MGAVLCQSHVMPTTKSQMGFALPRSQVRNGICLNPVLLYLINSNERETL